MFWLKIPVFVATIAAGYCPLVSLKYPAMSRLEMLKMPQPPRQILPVVSCLQTLKHSLLLLSLA